MIRRIRRVLRPARRAWRTIAGSIGERMATRRELARLPRPVTFNEKVKYKMLADRRPLLTTFADKLASRDYVESRVGAHVLTELYAVTDKPGSLSAVRLPREFVVKPTHASGAAVLVAEFAPANNELPEPTEKWNRTVVRPDALRRDRLVETCESWIARPYSRTEWAYRKVPRRIIVEELLEEDGRVAFDYKFFVFHGRVRVVEVDLDRFERHTRNLYTPEWERLPAEYRCPAGVDLDPPRAFAEMLGIAEILGAETDFVRVDLYCPDGRVVFGELTSYPLAGAGTFRPEAFDTWLGAWWTVPRRYR